MKSVFCTLILAACFSTAFASQNIGVVTQCPQKDGDKLLFGVQANKHSGDQSFVLCSYGSESNTQNILYTDAINGSGGAWVSYGVYRECITNGNTYNCPIIRDIITK